MQGKYGGIVRNPEKNSECGCLSNIRFK